MAATGKVAAPKVSYKTPSVTTLKIPKISTKVPQLKNTGLTQIVRGMKLVK